MFCTNSIFLCCNGIVPIIYLIAYARVNRNLLDMTLTARKFSEGHMPFSYYNLKHRHSIFMFLLILFFGFKGACFCDDRKEFPDLHDDEIVGWKPKNSLSEA